MIINTKLNTIGFRTTYGAGLGAGWGAGRCTGRDLVGATGCGLKKIKVKKI